MEHWKVRSYQQPERMPGIPADGEHQTLHASDQKRGGECSSINTMLEVVEREMQSRGTRATKTDEQFYKRTWASMKKLPVSSYTYSWEKTRRLAKQRKGKRCLSNLQFYSFDCLRVTVSTNC